MRSKVGAVVTVAGSRAKTLKRGDTKYVRDYRADPSAVEPSRECIRVSGNVAGHVVYVRSEERFQVDLTDQTTFERVTIYVATVVGERVTASERTVAFRAAVREARWVSRTQRKGKRLLVRQLASKVSVTIDSRAE